MRYVIIGGVAAGASAAARLRRLDERAEIVLLEKGSDISYANCGLPYHVGGVIAARARLSVMPPAKFASWSNVDVRTNCEATAIDRAKTYVTCCAVGLRGYLAERILKQNGLKAYNLSGGWATWRLFHPEREEVRSSGEGEQRKEDPSAVQPSTSDLQPSSTLDLRQLPCPGPVVQLKAAFSKAADGAAFKVLADATFEGDLRRWCAANGCTASGLAKHGGELEAMLVKGGPQPSASASSRPAEHSAAIVLFSNDLDKALAAMILANGLAASGAKVGIFFTFWGLSVLRRDPAPTLRRSLVSRMFGWMLPKGAERLALSKMNMLGLGTAMMKDVMRRQNIMTLPALIKSAKAADVKFIACDMAMGVMGLAREDLIDEVDEVAGVAAFAEIAKRSANTLFI